MNHLLFWISYFGHAKGNLCQVSAAQAVHSHYCAWETYWTYILISEPLLLQIQDNLHHMSGAALWRTDKRQPVKGQKPLDGWRCSLLLNAFIITSFLKKFLPDEKPPCWFQNETVLDVAKCLFVVLKMSCRLWTPRREAAQAGARRRVRSGSVGPPTVGFPTNWNNGKC